MSQGKVVSSLIYKSSERLLVKGLGLIISIILARLLSPTEFGQIALIMVFINLSIVLIDSGLNTALVQDKNTTNEDYSTVFYISFAIASIVIVILWLCAPYIGKYYNDDAIVLPLRVYSFSLLVHAGNAVLIAKMQREMRFKQMMWCNLIVSILSGTAGIAMAYAGLGIWALVNYYFLSALLLFILLSLVTRWHPIWFFSITRAKTLFSYGWKMLVSGFLCSIYNDLRALIIGKVYSPADLGYYNRGQQFPDIISHTIDNAIQSVMFPVMAKEQDDIGKIRMTLSRTISMGALIIMPLMFGLAAVAHPFIELLLTAKWLPCVVYMQWIAIGCSSVPLSRSCLVAIQSIGRSDIYMKLELVRRIAMLIVLMISVFCFNSVLAIAVGFAISSWLDYFIIIIPVKRLIGLDIKQQIKATYKIIFSSIFMAIIVFMIGQINLQPWLLLLIQVPVGLVLYLLACYLIKIECFMDLLNKILKL